jgi:hypothetical protein
MRTQLCAHNDDTSPAPLTDTELTCCPCQHAHKRIHTDQQSLADTTLHSLAIAAKFVQSLSLLLLPLIQCR